MSAATARTGLDDFGGDSFREGMEILVRALRDEARLNARGEKFVYGRIGLHLAQRLQVEDWYRRHPEIDEEPIRAPLFGIGLPRTGSTALSFLLAQDPNIRYLRIWESAQPCPPPSTVRGDDPRIPPGEIEVVAGSRRHVPTDIHGPMECLDLMALDFKSQVFQAYAQVPSYSEWFVDKADFTSTYAYQRRVLKLLQWGEPTRPWRLKSPAHVLSLGALGRAFPDARFVMTHRDPTDVMLSVADVYADIVGGFTDHLDRRYLGELNINQWSIGMKRVVQFRGSAERRFYDIDFGAMQADPVAEVTRLYGWLGEPVTDEFDDGMRAWWTENAEKREPHTRADPELFGLDLNRIRPLFDDYVEHGFTGSGLRIRRQGVRRLDGFWGHCWQSALFDSGRAFGYIAYPPRPDGVPTFNEGYLFDGDGGLVPARVVEAPWLRRLQPRGEDVSVVFATATGIERIDGETVVSTPDITDPSDVPAEQLAKMANWTFPALQQAGARYRWNGEETYGMLERSSPMDKIAR
jgi:hypothetical protein